MLKRLLNKYKYDILIFLFLSFQFYLMKPLFFQGEIHKWVVAPYILSYKYGIAPRLLIGSFISLFVSYISKEFLYYFILASIIFLCFLLSLFFGSCIRAIGSYNENKNKTQLLQTNDINLSLFVLIALYLASPASVAFLFQWSGFGQMDTYLFIYSLLALFFIRHKILKFTLPILCLMAVATHHGFIFTYFQIILGILIYYVYENKFDKKSLVFSFITIVVTCFAFIYFQLFAKINLARIEDFAKIIQKNSDLLPLTSVDMIKFGYFKNITEHGIFFINKILIVRGSIAFILMLPMHLIYIYIFSQAIKHNKDKTLNIVFMIVMHLPLCSIPIFILACDWGRWLSSIYTTQLLIILYLAKIKCVPVIEALKVLSVKINKYLCIVIMLILYYSILGKFELNYVLLTVNILIEDIVPFFT